MSIGLRVRVCASVSWVHMCAPMLACVNVHVNCVHVITRACVYIGYIIFVYGSIDTQSRRSMGIPLMHWR